MDVATGLQPRGVELPAELAKRIRLGRGADVEDLGGLALGDLDDPNEWQLLAGVHTTQQGGTATTDDLSTSLTLNTVISAGVAQTVEPWNTIAVVGLLVVSGTAGSFTLQWAQNSISATATVAKTNSFLSLRRVE